MLTRSVFGRERPGKNVDSRSSVVRLYGAAYAGLREGWRGSGQRAQGHASRPAAPAMRADVRRSHVPFPPGRGGLNGRRLWGRADSLDDHFRRHVADFGAGNTDDLVQWASNFIHWSQADGMPTKIGPDGTIRVCDPKSNTFGSFNPDGTTRAF